MRRGSRSSAATLAVALGIALLGSPVAAQDEAGAPPDRALDATTAYMRAQDFLLHLYELVSAPDNIPKLRALYEDPKAGPPIELQGQYEWARACFQLVNVTPLADGSLRVKQNVAFLIAQRTKARFAFMTWLMPRVPAERVRLVSSTDSSLLLVPTSDGTSYKARVDPREAHLAAGDCWTDDWLTRLFSLPKVQPQGLPGGSSCDCDRVRVATTEEPAETLTASATLAWDCVGPTL